MTISSPSDIAIHSTDLEARFRADWGGRMTRLRHGVHGDILVPCLSWGHDPHVWPKAGAFPLFPFHNHIHDAAFQFDGRVISLTPRPGPAGGVLHGPAHLGPWQVLSHGTDQLTLQLNHSASSSWPFDFQAKQHFRLIGTELQIGLSFCNSGARTMPGGLGWHPYFNTVLGPALGCDAAQRWTADASTGARKSEAVERTPDGSLSLYSATEDFACWSHASINHPSGAQIVMKASDLLSHLVVHKTNTYCCLEPVSHAIGAFSNLTDPDSGSGVLILAPGQTVTARISVTVAGGRSPARCA